MSKRIINHCQCWIGWPRPPLIQVVAALFGLLFNGGHAVQAEITAKTVEDVREIYPNEWGVPHPEGLTYSAKHNRFYLLEKNPSEQAIGQSTLVALTPYEEMIDKTVLNFNIGDAINITFDDNEDRLFLLGSSPLQLVQLKLKADGTLDPASETRYDATRFGLKNPEGMTVDHRGKFLFILDRATSQVTRIEIKDPIASARFQKFYLAPKGLTGLRGIAVNIENHRLMVMSPRKKMLYELTEDFKYLAQYDMAPLKLVDPLALVFAYSTDLTDDEKTVDLFVADSNFPTTLAADEEGEEELPFRSFLPFIQSGDSSVSADTAESATAQETGFFGKIIEINVATSNSGPGALQAASAAATLSLRDTFRTSSFNPPSPDPTGISYDADRGQLIISDSEVEEMSIYAGRNVFYVTPANPTAVVLSRTTTGFSREPTGVAHDQGGGRLFFCDDDAKRVYTVTLRDGIFDANDPVTSFRTSSFGSNDPEGLEYDETRNVLWLLDDANREVYQVSTSGSRISQFDILQYNIRAPEGIVLAPNGNLFIVGRNTTTVFELSTTGALRATHDVSAANAIKFSGIEVAPARNGTGNSLWLLDRGIDNDVNSRENDGRLFEFMLP